LLTKADHVCDVEAQLARALGTDIKDDGAAGSGWGASRHLGGPVLCGPFDPAELEATAERMQALLIAGQKAEALKSVRPTSL
jgi:hypothetical protein